MSPSQIIARAGGVTALAAALGLDHSSISKWKVRGIPIERIPAISRLTGIPRHELRPELWDDPAKAIDEVAS